MPWGLKRYYGTGSLHFITWSCYRRKPLLGNPSKILQAVKLSVSRRLAIGRQFSGRFWQSRFYDFNLWGQQKEIEKLKYMHRNPVVRGLVASPEDWRWSSYRSYAYREAGLVRINDWTWWEEKIRRSFVSAKSPDPHRHRDPPVKPPRVGHPVHGSFIGKCVGWASPPPSLLSRSFPFRSSGF